MASALTMASQDPQQLLLGSSSALAEGVTLQPVFIPRQHSGIPGGLNPLHHQQGAGSPPHGSSAAGADWAYLLRSAAALRHGSLQGPEDGRATSPQVLPSPGSLLLASSQGMALQQASNSASGLFGSSSMSALDGLTQLSAEALAAATGDPSNSLVMLSNSNLAPTLSSMSGMSGMYADGSVQTLYGSNDAAAAASAAAAAAAAAAARATTTQSILQQQAAAAASNANMGSGALAGLGSSLNLNSLMKLEESLSGTLFGPGGTPAVLSPKPVSASLYIKNLPADADKLFLYEKFSPYGAILSVKVLNDPQSGQCRGVGFVNFAEHSSAVRSIQALHGTKVGDKLLHVSLQTPRLRAAVMSGM